MSLPSLMGITLVVGLLLGLLGGGGSILLVPVLVYLVGLETKVAIATTLVVVGLTSLVAVMGHARAGRVCWKNGWAFGLAGMLGSLWWRASGSLRARQRIAVDVCHHHAGNGVHHAHPT